MIYTPYLYIFNSVEKLQVIFQSKQALRTKPKLKWNTMSHKYSLNYETKIMVIQRKKLMDAR